MNKTHLSFDKIIQKMQFLFPIEAGKSGLKMDGTKKKLVSTFNPKSVKAWSERDKNMPPYDSESAEVAKFSMLQVTTMWCVVVIERNLGANIREGDIC